MGHGTCAWRRQAGILLLGCLGLVVFLGIVGCGSQSATPGPTPTPTPTANNPVPAATSLSPSSSTMGGLAFTLTVRGSNFVPASTVNWNGNSRTTTFVDSGHLQAHIMAADLAAAGKVAITVVNPAPGGGTSNAVNFTVPTDAIVFSSNRALDGSDTAIATSNIWIMHSDGSMPSPLTQLTGSGTNSSSPVWSADGSKTAFISQRALDGSNTQNTNATANIWVMNADGSSPTPLTKLTGNGTSPADLAWSPDGSKIAFWSRRAFDGSDSTNFNQTRNIWVINSDGTNPKPLTQLDNAVLSDSFGPTWSPDGSKIAFYSARVLDGSNNGANTNSTFNIWIMNPDGSNPTPLTRLTAATGNSRQPVWSRDGVKIAFASGRALDGSNSANTLSGATNIWVVNADGSGAVPLTNMTRESSSTPAWSPDGSKVAFVSGRALDGSDSTEFPHIDNIWVVNANGSSPTPLTKIDTADAFSETPIWSPAGDKIFFDSKAALNGSNSVSLITDIWVATASGSSLTPLTTLTNAVCIAPRQP